METKILSLSEDLDETDLEKIKLGADYLKRGKLVSFPTETVYGLGANGLDEEAVKKIYQAKGRPSDNPLILHISSLEELDDLVLEVGDKAKLCMEKFWPGPLTIIFKRSDLIPDIITGGLDTVAIRMPDHRVARKIISYAGCPIAAPSANTSGRPSPTRADHVREDLDGRIDMIIDGGPCGIGLESTVLDLSGDQALILRPGDVSLEDLKKILPEVKEDKSIVDDSIRPKSPGQKYKHYAPKGEMILFTGDLNSIINKIGSYYEKYISMGKSIGILSTDESMDRYRDLDVELLSLGSREDLASIGSNLFNSLRYFDRQGVDLILAEGVGYDDLGMAIMNRMVKAAGGNIVKA